MKYMANKVQKLKKYAKNRPVHDKLLKEPFVLPVPSPEHQGPRAKKPDTACINCTGLTKVNSDLARELCEVKGKYDQSSQQFENLNKQLVVLKQFQPYRLNQKLKRKDEQLAKKQKLISKLRRKYWTDYKENNKSINPTLCCRH